MEVAGFTETSVSFYQTLQCVIPEDDSILQNQLTLFEMLQGTHPLCQIAQAGKVCTVALNTLNMELV
jgi:hypothetical protein